MSSPRNEGPLSSNSTTTATNDIAEPLEDQKEYPDIIIDWDGSHDPENPRKLVHVTLFSKA